MEDDQRRIIEEGLMILIFTTQFLYALDFTL